MIFHCSSSTTILHIVVWWSILCGTRRFHGNAVTTIGEALLLFGMRRQWNRTVVFMRRRPLYLCSFVKGNATIFLLLVRGRRGGGIVGSKRKDHGRRVWNLLQNCASIRKKCTAILVEQASTSKGPALRPFHVKLPSLLFFSRFWLPSLRVFRAIFLCH